MMDWITAIWNKINKPLHFLFVGAALVLFAPPAINWTGYIFAAAGVAGSVEWLASQVRSWLEKRGKVRSLLQCFDALNGDEKRVLQIQVQKGEQTFYLNWNDYHGLRALPDAADKYSKMSGIYLGLQDKGILTIRTEDTNAVLHITEPAWVYLKEQFAIFTAQRNETQNNITVQ